MNDPLHKVFFRSLAGSICLVLLCVFGKVYSQQPIDKWIEKGESARLDQSYPEAIKYFEWAMRKESDPRPYIGLGKCYRSLRDYQNAAKYFGKAAGYPDVKTDVYFFLAQSLLATGDKKGAEKWFRIYTENTPDEEQVVKWEDLRSLFEKEQPDSTQLEVTRFPYNTSSSDFSAVPVGTSLYFCSSRKTKSSIVHVSTLNDAPLIDLYKVDEYFNPDKRQKPPKPLSELNSRYNEGPMCFSSDEKTMYFTRNNSELKRARESRVSLNKLRIYKSVWEGDHWTEGESLPFNNDDYAVGHPALSPDNSRLYFVSDMPGGQGGTDVYYVDILPGGGYGIPKNLGSKVNSPGDEMFPFIAGDGALYFASDNHLGFGGLDIFKSIPVGSIGWSIPYNLGPPVNSPEDDFAYLLYEDGKTGLFSSNRGKSHEDDDIYEFRIARPTFECTPQEKNTYCYRFSEVGSFDIESDTNSQFIYEWDFGDGSRSVGLVVEHCFPGPGDYLVQLNLIDTVSDFVFMNEATEMVVIRDIEQIYIKSPDTVIVDEEFELDATESIFKGVKIKEYYWDIGGLELRKGEKTSFSFPEPGLFEIQLGVVGNERGNAEDKKGCATKLIRVLAPERLREIRDSLGNGFIDPQTPGADWNRYGDSLRLLQEMELVDRIKEIRDSIGADKIDSPERTTEGLALDGYDFQVGGPKFYDPTNPPERSPLISDLPESVEGKNVSSPPPPSNYSRSILITVIDETVDTLYQLRLPAKIQGRRLLIPLKGTPLWEEGMEEELVLSYDEDLYDFMVRKNTGSKEPEMILERDGKKIASLLRKCTDCLPVSSYLPYPDGKTDYELIQFRNIQEILERGLIVRLSDVYFDFDSDQLRSEYVPYLDRLAKIMTENPEINIEIRGHTDSDGSDSYNERLSRQRAYAIAKYFILSGYDIENFLPKGYGEKFPVSSNKTSYGKQLNRRVEFRFFIEK